MTQESEILFRTDVLWYHLALNYLGLHLRIHHQHPPSGHRPARGHTTGSLWYAKHHHDATVCRHLCSAPGVFSVATSVLLGRFNLTLVNIIMLGSIFSITTACYVPDLLRSIEGAVYGQCPVTTAEGRKQASSVHIRFDPRYEWGLLAGANGVLGHACLWSI